LAYDHWVNTAAHTTLPRAAGSKPRFMGESVSSGRDGGLGEVSHTSIRMVVSNPSNRTVMYSGTVSSVQCTRSSGMPVALTALVTSSSTMSTASLMMRRAPHRSSVLATNSREQVIADVVATSHEPVSKARSSHGCLRHIEGYAKPSLKKCRPIAARNEDEKVFSGRL